MPQRDGLISEVNVALFGPAGHEERLLGYVELGRHAILGTRRSRNRNRLSRLERVGEHHFRIHQRVLLRRVGIPSGLHKRWRNRRTHRECRPAC